MEYQSFEGENSDISISFVLTHREIVADFFGDRRDWYSKLLKSGITYNKTSIDSKKPYDTDRKKDDDVIDFPPVEPEEITENRAKNIAAFFKEVPGAKEAFLEYVQHIKKNEGEAVKSV